MLWNMLHDKEFIVTEGQHTSPKTFKIRNGLQQDTVNSPILFNIYTSDLLQRFNLNNDNKKSALAFADDLLIYVKDNKPSKIKIDLQELFGKIQNYLHPWKLKINLNKCESILFRPYISKISGANKNVRIHSKKFCIHDSYNTNSKILHKEVVRYLGVHLDFKLNFNKHIDIQISKAEKAFMANRRMFYSKDLNKNVKLLLYKLLIRPILTYGCAIWFNISASTMEKIRIFERKCIRACLSKYRTPESNYTKNVSNHQLYNEAN